MAHKSVMKKRNHLGSYTPKQVIKVCDGTVLTLHKDGLWYTPRPMPYYSIKERLQQAWDVLTYKADALYWTFEDGTGFDRKTEAQQAENKSPNDGEGGVKKGG